MRNKKNLFYTVNKNTKTTKVIRVFKIEDNFPIELCWIKVFKDSPYSREEEIQEWLDNNGYEDEQFEFYRL